MLERYKLQLGAGEGTRFRGKMVITDQTIEQGKSFNGGWSKKQLEVLEVPIHKGFKLEKGWKKRLVGSEVSEEKVETFLALKDKHLINKSPLTSQKEGNK